MVTFARKNSDVEKRHRNSHKENMDVKGTAL
jgi:hypothetical protein